ncbi:metalloreductase STEAP4-like [Eriocheir sinensis]|uniref:metalloreductase STEAP4-like n=1 Tax=Eriocheir sinensis TaxID=95602 RepID=UPI0021C83A56|nr:metalloreductase STEAP4-like [Eriocheir sinensis]
MQNTGIKRKFHNTKTNKPPRRVSTNNAGSQTQPVLIMKDGSLDPDTLIEVMAVHPYNKRDASAFNTAFERSGMDTKGDESSQEIVGVLGSGDYGRAIAGKIAQSGFTVLIGSRDPNNPQIQELVRGKQGCRLVTQEEAAKADIVVVAVGADHYRRLPLNQLKHKVVIDVANFTAPPPPHQPSNAEVLQQLAPQAYVVKSFNVLSAYALENSVQQQAKQVPVASDWPEARRRVLEMVKQMGYSAVDKGPLKFARDIEAIPLQLMPAWRRPLMIVGSLWVFHYLLLLFKYQVCGSIQTGESWRQATLRNLALMNVNRTTAITALWTLTLCYLPGVMAGYIQLAWGTKYRRFPSWLDTWLKMRKQLGLLMLWLAAVHTILGVAVWSGMYDSLIWDPPLMATLDVRVNSTTFVQREVPIYSSTMSLQGEMFLTCGVLSMLITCIVGVSSLPSVGATLTWREFNFIQSKLGWLALITGTLHDGLVGWGFSADHYTVCSLPSCAQYALIFPLLTITLKALLLVPCVDGPLQKIRRGYDRVKSPPAVHPMHVGHYDMSRRSREDRNGLWHVLPPEDRPRIINA